MEKVVVRIMIRIRIAKWAEQLKYLIKKANMTQFWWMMKKERILRFHRNICSVEQNFNFISNHFFHERMSCTNLSQVI